MTATRLSVSAPAGIVCRATSDPRLQSFKQLLRFARRSLFAPRRRSTKQFQFFCRRKRLERIKHVAYLLGQSENSTRRNVHVRDCSVFVRADARGRVTGRRTQAFSASLETTDDFTVILDQSIEINNRSRGRAFREIVSLNAIGASEGIETVRFVGTATFFRV